MGFVITGLDYIIKSEKKKSVTYEGWLETEWLKIQDQDSIFSWLSHRDRSGNLQWVYLLLIVDTVYTGRTKTCLLDLNVPRYLISKFE